MNPLYKIRPDAAILMSLLTLFSIIAYFIIGATAPSFNFQLSNLSSLEQTQEQSPQEKNLVELKSLDKASYEEVFALQYKGNWNKADNIIKNIHNPLLMGHVLSQRYLHPNYKSTASELSQWMSLYSDHPQAKRIQQLARAKGVKISLAKTARRNLSGYGESYKNIRYESPRIAGIWKSGLRYWQAKNYEKAYTTFSSLEGLAKTMGDWDKAAISFWAFRSANEIGEYDKAAEHLEYAAKFPRSFYGAQAVHILGDSLNDTVALRGKESLGEYMDEIDSVETRKALRRIEALLQTGKTDIARDEMILHYAMAKPADRVAFAPLAEQMNLPALQLRMGVDMERKGITSGEALYPLPKWQPTNGYTVDPALVFAVARQESGFNIKAKSHVGAQGTMQIMPETAKYIAKKMKVRGQVKLNDPVTSITLGQHYLTYLSNKPYIKGNIVLLAAAYNAGPGTAKRWSKRPSMGADPLYFIETLPFSETRDYIMNVMTNYWMYREIMNDGDPGATLLSQGQWPKTLTSQKPEVARLDLSWPNAS